MEKPNRARLNAHFGEMRSELTQVDKVLEDAVATLFGAFSNIADLVRLQQKISTQFGLLHQAAEENPAGRHPAGWIEDDDDPALARRDSSMALLFAQQAAVSDQLERQVNAVVQSLQFQDIATQLLARALNRVAVLESIIGIPDATGRLHKRRHEGDPAKPRGSAREEGVAEVIVFPRSHGPAHSGMKAGDVELF